MGHFKAGPPEEFWKGFQQHMGYSDAELKLFKKDPKKFKWAPVLASPKIRNLTLVFEVMETHGCAEGMKAGDKLYFKGLTMLDPTRSSPWCSYAITYAITLSFACHNLALHGIDPNEMYGDHFNCWDCGSKRGWGNIAMKAYVIDESKKQPKKLQAAKSQTKKLQPKPQKAKK
jgi:hypothetical protein